MTFVRGIGRWTMTALVINCIIGGGIFGLPGELTRLLGRASPIAMIAAALGMGILIACFAEVASQFSDAGGAYLYTRAAFGSFISTQIGWMQLLSVVSGPAALATLFVEYLGTLLPRPLETWERVLVMAVLLAIPAVANYRGVKTGATLSNLTTVAKLTPLLLLVWLGVGRFAHQPQIIHTAEIASPGISNWMRAMVFAIFAFSGWEDSVIPTGEIKEPRRTIPFGLGSALLVSAAVYTLLQFITVATIGTKVSDASLAETASVLLGANGARFVTVAALISIYGYITGEMLNGPRLVYALGAHGEFPKIFARIHPRFHTPAVGIPLYATIAFLLAASGKFLWLVAIGSGAGIVLYGMICAAMIRLRRSHPKADAFRVPFGPAFSVVGIAICVGLLTGLQRSEVLLMCVPVVIAGCNWLLTKRRLRASGPESVLAA
jgi:APA family basic amino acid/polyamine antiporter